MKKITTITACLFITACEPYEPPQQEDTDSRPPSNTSPGQKPQEPNYDPFGCADSESTCDCATHYFAFDSPLPPTLQFPNPLGAKDFDGLYVDTPLECTSVNADNFSTYPPIDLSGVEPFFVDPSWRVRGGVGPFVMDSQIIAQLYADEYVCSPASQDEGAAAWKWTADRATVKAAEECGTVLESMGCIAGQYPVDGKGNIGVGAVDVCLSFMAWHLRDFLGTHTEKLRYDGLQKSVIDVTLSTCAEGPIDESCEFGGSTG